MRRRIVDRLKRGRRLRAIAEEMRVPYQFVRQVAAESGLVYVGRQLDSRQEREIRERRDECGESIRTIASEMGLPKSKVGRFCRRTYLDVVADGADEGFEVEETTTRRCPKHGLVNVWPCVACAAGG